MILKQQKELLGFAKKLGTGIIITGPGGSVKNQLARELARIMVCVKEGAEDCDCASCRAFFSGAHPDISTLRRDAGARTLGIDLVREHLRLTDMPAVGKRRAVIVEDVGTMTEEAQNAILKVSEDYPDKLAIIGLYNGGRLLPTIKSRVPVFEVSPMDEKDFTEKVKDMPIVKNGKVSVKDYYLFTGGYPEKEVDITRYGAVLSAIRKGSSMDFLKALNAWAEGDRKDFLATQPENAPDMVAFISRCLLERFEEDPRRIALAVLRCGKEELLLRKPSYGKLEWAAFLIELCEFLEGEKEDLS